ncbi:diadenylate cyclase CdaA [Halodesulfovibrio sp.]|uniref:diadenylate cyclase CdaA n=1 Tax=Halodesulfovibrio sp. TaxID=1912772 RepID=UPI0026012190|nr:diadenylate cyclase CdaA [Halodesulfovibrio sp.]MCT4536211.1 diadenylate cyclase CdaA [Halodesulfovibrio sp.]MCT4626855.1 diadenylate cyclase CdaA [Halodesulfovibrio sp.]
MDALEYISITWRDALDIAFVTLLFYQVMIVIRGTRAVSAIYGLLLLIAVFAFSEYFGFYTLHWILQQFLSSFFLVVVILFQDDIRRGLSNMGARSFYKKTEVEDSFLDEVIGAAVNMAKRKVGALIVLEHHVPLGDVAQRGVLIDSAISKELLVTIFQVKTPLHDGAVIVRRGRVAAAGCILPLAVGDQDRPEYGTRHRAALGITEETDAIAIVVSEERGDITVAVNGRLTSNLDRIRLKRVLRNLLER